MAAKDKKPSKMLDSTAPIEIKKESIDRASEAQQPLARIMREIDSMNVRLNTIVSRQEEIAHGVGQVHWHLFRRKILGYEPGKTAQK